MSIIMKCPKCGYNVFNHSKVVEVRSTQAIVAGDNFLDYQKMHTTTEEHFEYGCAQIGCHYQTRNIDDIIKVESLRATLINSLEGRKTGEYAD